MKKLVYLISLALLIISCQSEKQYVRDSPEIDLAKKGNEAYVKKDWTTIRSLFADSAKILLNSWWGEEITPEEYISILQQSASNYSEYSFSDDSFYEMITNDDGDKWVHAWLLWSGTNNNGTQVKTVVNLGWLVENDKVITMSVLYDALPLYQAANPPEQLDSLSVE